MIYTFLQKIKKHKILLLSLVFFLFSSFTIRLFATPYTAPATLDPTCAPSAADCYVVISVTGVSGGQSVIGGTASGDDLTLTSTSNATKGNINFGTSTYDEVNNVMGIGTTTPATSGGQLEVAASGVNPMITITGYSNVGSEGPYLIGRRAAGTSSAPLPVEAGQQLLMVGGLGYYDGTPDAFTAVTTGGVGAFISFNAQNAWTTASQSTYMDFYTTIIGSTTPVKAMTLTNNGFIHTTNRIGINLANPTNTAYRLDVNESSTSASAFTASFKNTGNSANSKGLRIQSGLNDPSTGVASTLIDFQDGDGGAIGAITFLNNDTLYTSLSDRRLKENIVDTSLSLSDLMKVHIRDFNWKNDKNKKLSHGVIAQELAEVYPGAVSIPDPANPDGLWQVDYSRLSPLIIKAVQDQQIEILDLQLKSGYQFDSNTASSSIADLFMKFISNETDKVIGGIVTIKDAIIDKITAKEIKTDKLCVGETCITEEQFKQIFNNQNTIVPTTEIVPVVAPVDIAPIVETPTVVEIAPVVEPITAPGPVVEPVL